MRAPHLIGVMVVMAVLVAAPGAQAGEPLTLTISSPRVQGGPITFTAAGVAPPRDSEGYSQDYVAGAVIPQSRQCAFDSFGDIPGSVVDTVGGFPAGPFEISYRLSPVGLDPGDLLAGAWRECVYLLDRDSNTVQAQAQEDFAVRTPHERLRLLNKPAHVRFAYDSVGRPTARVTFVVRAAAELTNGRTLQVSVEPPGENRSCARLEDPIQGLRAGSEPYRLRSRTSRTYRIRTDVIAHAGPMPYGKRARVCAVIAYYEPLSGTYVAEDAVHSSWRIRR